MGYDITIHRDISCDITRDHSEETGNQTRNLVAVYCLFSTLFYAHPGASLKCTYDETYYQYYYYT